MTRGIEQLGPRRRGEIEQPATAILSVESVGEAEGDVFTRDAAAKHGGFYYGPARLAPVAAQQATSSRLTLAEAQAGR